jgi:hypothetical protein
MPVSWWRDPEYIVHEAHCNSSISVPESYRFGDGVLSVASDDAGFVERFRSIYGECRCDVDAVENLPRVHAEIRSYLEPKVVVVSVVRPQPLDSAAFFPQLFPELRLVPFLPGQDWQMLAQETAPAEPVIAFRRDHVIIDCRLPWQRLVSEYLIGDVMRLQDKVMFFHAASVGIGEKGVLITGAKGAGKSTLSMGLAARGHAFLGDDLSALRIISRELIPCRRIVSIREGPRPKKLDSSLASGPYRAETMSDGTTRIRAIAGRLFPAARPREVVMTHAFFLRSFTSQFRIEPFEAEQRYLGLIAPLVATTWALPPGQRAVRFLNMLAGIKCFHVDIGGTPDQMTDAIEKSVR